MPFNGTRKLIWYHVTKNLSDLEPLVHKTNKGLEATQVLQIKDLMDRWRRRVSSGYLSSFIIREVPP